MNISALYSKSLSENSFFGIEITHIVLKFLRKVQKKTLVWKKRFNFAV